MGVLMLRDDNPAEGLAGLIWGSWWGSRACNKLELFGWLRKLIFLSNKVGASK